MSGDDLEEKGTALLHGWDDTNSEWIKVQVNADGAIIIVAG